MAGDPSNYDSPSSTRLPEIGANQFEIKPSIIQMLPSFYGLSSKNPYKHIDEFLEVCSTFKFPNVSEDAIRLRLFPFSLKDKAKHWLTTRDNIATWDQMSKEFLKKYFPAGIDHNFQNQVLSALKNLDPMRQLLYSHTQSIAKLETQVGQLANTIARRDEGKLPSFPMENPRGQTYQEETKAVTTLRSGKIIDNKVDLDNNEANEEKEKEFLREKSQTNKVKDIIPQVVDESIPYEPKDRSNGCFSAKYEG
ncbi:uncharacterized protein G2W53_041444 [Senna tora]|uniref:Retrotransposon gag domain-containing protein n=1 Tax=Senna tora TaxID=362788 RepID=A0A834SHF7_9FABA|nr:uncharacterized protein G2W53_041444 [Senna tora]